MNVQSVQILKGNRVLIKSRSKEENDEIRKKLEKGENRDFEIEKEKKIKPKLEIQGVRKVTSEESMMEGIERAVGKKVRVEEV